MTLNMSKVLNFLFCIRLVQGSPLISLKKVNSIFESAMKCVNFKEINNLKATKRILNWKHG